MNKSGLLFFVFLAISSSVIAAGLEGIWRSNDGEVLVISGNQWATHEYGMLTDAGNFQLQGNTLSALSQLSGAIQGYTISLSGDSLSLTQFNGTTYHYKRLGSGNTHDSYSQNRPSQPDPCGGMSFEDCMINRYGVMPPSINIWE